MEITNERLASMIDHTNLKPTAGLEDIKKLCKEAADNHFASVCVNSVWVPAAAAMLEGTGVEVCTVVGFPLGACSHDTKAAETAIAVENGASEVDMVLDIGAAKDGRWDSVREDVEGVVTTAHEAAAGKKVTVKVILENCYLTKEEIVRACQECVAAHADFVKTSTGFGTGGATVEDVALMKKTVGDSCKVKAAGGIRDRATAIALVEAGADRLGCSAGLQIIKG